MPKEEWGVKRLCPTTGKRFYDMGRDPIVSPYTGEVLELDTGKRSMIAADAEDAASKKAQGLGKTNWNWIRSTTTMSMSIWTMMCSMTTMTMTTSRSTKSPMSRPRTTSKRKTEGAAFWT